MTALEENRLWSEQAARAWVAARAGGRCELCWINTPHQWSHRRDRSKGGLWVPWNGLHLCGPCHLWTHSYGDFADLGGWRLVHNPLDPELVPVWLQSSDGTGWYLLERDGLKHPLDHIEAGLPARPLTPRWAA